MSADAKIWQDDNEYWCAVHDGDCQHPKHRELPYGLVQLIRDVEGCLKHKDIRWMMHVYPDGKAGLRGFIA